MVSLFLRRNSVGLIALFVALGGTSYAAVKLPKNSVGSSQIKAKAVSGSELKNNAVTSAKVKNGSLLASDLKAGVIPTVPATATPTDGSVTTPKLADGSVTTVKLGKAPAVRLSVATATTQTIADAASVFALFPTTDYNNDSAFTVGTASGGSTLTVPVAGVYVITAQVNWFDDALTHNVLDSNGSAPGGTITDPSGCTAGTTVAPATCTTVREDNGINKRSLFLFGNGGAANYGGSTIRGVENDFTRQSASAVAFLAAGTVLSVVLSQDSGFTLTTRGSQNQVSFSATLLSR